VPVPSKSVRHFLPGIHPYVIDQHLLWESACRIWRTRPVAANGKIQNEEKLSCIEGPDGTVRKARRRKRCINICWGIDVILNFPRRPDEPKGMEVIAECPIVRQCIG